MKFDTTNTNTTTPTPSEPGGWMMTADDVLKASPDEVIQQMNAQSAQVDDSDFADERSAEFAAQDFESDEKPKRSPIEAKNAQKASFTVVNLADRLISEGLGMYAKTEADTLRANPADLEAIAEQFEEYFGVGSFNPPPWLMGSILAVMVIGDKFKTATEIRKANLKLEAEQARTATLEARIRDLELKEREQELKLKVQQLEAKTEQAA